MRFQRLIARVASRRFDYSGLRQAGSPGEAVAWAQGVQPQFFNGNVLRAKVVQGVIECNSCDCFIETGTSHAATTIGVRRYLGLPVWSYEINPRDYRISWFVTFGMSGISLFNLDSGEFLPMTIAKMKISKSKPFIYLDAHEGEINRDSLPLVDEVGFILELESFVVLIDDFRVPLVDGFGWGTYGGIAVEVGLIGDVLSSAGIRNCYFPAYAPSEETGYVSGYCLFWRSEALDLAMKAPAFPLSLIRAFAIDRGIYVGE